MHAHAGRLSSQRPQLPGKWASPEYYAAARRSKEVLDDSSSASLSSIGR